MIGQINDLYAQRCEHCGGYHVDDLADDDDNWDDIYRQIAEELLNNQDVKINADLHLKTAKKLINAIDKGLNTSELTDDEDSRKKLAEKLKQNIYPFSAAKSFTQMLYYRDMMVGNDGTVLGVDSFVKKIADTGEIFNKKYLEAEYENAYYSTIMADKWERFSEDDYLQYSTVGDRNVRPSHAVLDKYTAPKSDSFWKNNYPPNGWGCRCTVIPGKANYQNKLTPQEAGRQLKEENRDTPFYTNVGERKLIFKDNHPYFINSKGKEANLSWQDYGLPNLEKIRVNELPEYTPKTKEKYFDWWKNNSKNGIAVVKDILGNEVVLNDKFKDHILEKTSENRFQFGTETIQILKKPDEVWSNKEQGTVYIKYFESGTLKVAVRDGEVKTIFKLHSEDSGELKFARRGLLLHK